MYKRNIPIYDAIRRYTVSGTVPFHMPGHKMGRDLPREFLSDIASLDLTEIPGTDNLHHPAGAIRDAQMLAAEAFGAGCTYFLVNGSTCGIYAAISAVCKRGDSLIVNRDCHKSVIGGMMLAGVEPLYILPCYNDRFSINTGLPAFKVREALDSNPQAAGVLITRPNYYGICSDIEEMVDVVHSYGKPLIVDEAHGAHLRFSRRLPISGMEAGADICIQSAHKTLPALTQGAYLHVGKHAGDKHVDIERLEYFLRLYQTSSPSYIIMAFLDIARDIMQNEGEGLLDCLLDTLGTLKAAFGTPGLDFLEESDIAGYRLDSTRLTASFRGLGLGGYQAAALLRESYGIQVEMADHCNIVCITTPSDVEGSLGRLFDVFRDISCRQEGAPVLDVPALCPLSIPPRQLPFAEVMAAKKTRLRLDLSSGRISCSVVAPYPPGVPVLCPGEVILPGTVEYLKTAVESGAFIDGVDGNLEIDVI